jgi:hypothetical protein
MNDRPANRRQRASRFVRDFPWIHLGIGLVGNLAFVVGSVMFFYDGLATAAIWVFVVASAGMFVGSVGELVVRMQSASDGRWTPRRERARPAARREAPAVVRSAQS